MKPDNKAERLRHLAEARVLFVDDDALTRAQAQAYLEGRVQALHLAATGQEGLFAFARYRPDVLVTDVAMPGMDGLALTEAVRGIDEELPVVLLTALDDPAVLRRALALGVNGYLPKPLEPNSLLDALGHAAERLLLRRELSRHIRLNQLMLDAAPSPAVLVCLEPEHIAAANKLAVNLGYAAGGPCSGPLIPRGLLDELRRDGAGLMGAVGSRQVEAHGRHWILHWAPAGSGVVLFTAVDISQRVQFERFRDDVERIARHDLKTPLSAFTAVPDLLLMDDNLTTEQREFISLIRDSGARMLGMINLSLDLFRMESGTYRLPEDRFDFATTVRSAVEQTRAQARSLEVGLRLELPDRPAPVRGDELLCLSMLGNLLKNAVEASPPGAEVRVGLAAVAKGLARLDIQNRGEVPQDMRDRFFEKYATSGKRSGTGLGTYSALMVARAHGGEIALDASRPGQTTISLALPADDE